MPPTRQKRPIVATHQHSHACNKRAYALVMAKSFKLTAVLVASLIVAAGNFRFVFNSVLLDDERHSPHNIHSPRHEKTSLVVTATNFSFLQKAPKACSNATFLKELKALRKKQMKLFGPHQQPQEQNQTNHQHWPTFFKSKVQLFQLARRQNYLTPRSGCRLARWVVRSPTSETKAVIDCHMRHDQQVLNMTAIQDNDTIYVPLNALKRFVSQSLPLASEGYCTHYWPMAICGSTGLESNVCSINGPPACPTCVCHAQASVRTHIVPQNYLLAIGLEFSTNARVYQRVYEESYQTRDYILLQIGSDCRVSKRHSKWPTACTRTLLQEITCRSIYIGSFGASTGFLSYI